MWDYSAKVMDHFRHPRNVGEIDNPDAVGEIGNIVCGDALKLTLKIDRSTEKILDAKFQTFGCGSAIASSSALTEMIKGKTLDEASKITNKDIADYLDGLPEEKMHCSVMGMEALEAAINNYRGITTSSRQRPEGEKIICRCFGVTDRKIAQVIEMNNLTAVDQVTNYTKAGGGCGQCRPQIEAILAEILKKEREKKQSLLRKKMTNLERIRLIQETLEKEIRPYLQADGGDLELVDIDGHTVYIRLIGTCQSCPSMDFTIETFISQKLRQVLHEDIEAKKVEE
ncbi:MAG: Fe-S cluster assembly protein NifU [bacterium]|nr:Fe-S cluster assembly protein NifU [bacterium]